jgi:AraC-like DNA-binding protein
MNYRDFVSDLPLGRTAVFRSPEENEESMRRLGVNHQVRQLGRGQFRGDLAMIGTEQADFAADRYSTASAFRLESTPDTMCLLLLRSAGEPIRVLGTEVTRRNLVLLPAASGIDLFAPNLSGSEAIIIQKDRFVELIGALCPAVQPPEEAVVLEGDRTSLDTIRGEVLEMLAHPECVPDQGFVSKLLAIVIDCMAEGLGHRKSDRLPDARSRRRVAERAQAFIETHYREPVRVEDLCGATKVTARTLQRCFRHCFGLTLTEYLKAVRFEAARRDLAVAYPAEQTVAQIALDNGFTHLGRFSLEFKQRFGFSAYSLLRGDDRHSQQQPLSGDAVVSTT